MADTKGADNDAYNDIPLEDRIAIRAPDVPQAETPAVVEKEVPEEKVSFLGLFRYADSVDYLLMFFGTLFAIGAGVNQQLTFYFLSRVLDLYIFANASNNLTNCTENEFIASYIPQIAWTYTVQTITMFLFCYIHMTCWLTTSQRQTRVARRTAFHNIMRQHMGYFDTHKGGELNTRLTEDVAVFQRGLGDKMATFIQWVSCFVGGAILCLVRGWKLTLVLLSVAPIAAIIGAIIAVVQRSLVTKEMNVFAAAGAIAEESLAAIRTVAAFGGEKVEAERYEKCLMRAKTTSITKGIVSGVGQGFAWLVAFSIIAVAFLYGDYLVEKGEITPGFILQVQGSMFAGFRQLGWSVVCLEAVSAARGAAAGVFKIADAVSQIDSANPNGQKPKECKGRIVFQNSHFRYPSRMDVPVLNGLNLEIEPGQTAALVGPSGCGKSTTIQLLQRQYDPLFGAVLVDGVDTRDYNISWLRTQIGVVSQEPSLFAASIKENIRFGRDDCTDAEIIAAAKEASVDVFVQKLPLKYDTHISEMGTQLSRGQKQMICLARALVRKPKLLLLDEATSALDNESEAIVQDALERASKGRTTIVIAHRLSTVRNADILFVIDKGVVAEKGSHDELMAKNGLYHTLVSTQLKAGKDQEEKERLKMAEANVETNEFQKKDPAVEIERLRAMTEGRDRSNTTRSRSKSVISDIYEKRLAEEKAQDEMANEMGKVSIKRMLGYNKPEQCWLVSGVVCALLQGATTPSIAFLFTEALATFEITDEAEQQSELIKYIWITLGTGIAAAILTWAMVCQFTYCGEKLTMRLRIMAFTKMLQQEIGWFDEKANQVGALTSRLVNDASMVKGATTTYLMALTNAISCALLSLVVSYVFGWKLALVVSCVLPFLLGLTAIQNRLMMEFARVAQRVISEGGKIVSEVIDKIRTVAALTKEPFFREKYDLYYDEMCEKGKKQAHIFGLVWGGVHGFNIVIFLVAMTYGTFLVSICDIQFKNVFRVFIALVIGSIEVGRVTAFSSELSSGKVASARLLQLFDRESKINPLSTSGKIPDRCEGNVDFEDIKFSYPTRRDVDVLKNFNLTCKRGQMIAMVGASGTGKSTALQLLERFYEAAAGTVKLDGIDVRDLNIRYLRQQMAVVSQEPILFATSIAENIAYGDNSRKVTMDEVIAAAKAANIHNFIQGLPQGYETNVGSKGAQLSGGQKQRMAIARALIRNPKIIMLDDATSALDSESERHVQQALDKAQAGRTAIVIAHRLSTIVGADIICYVDKGRIVEKGTHGELMNMKGAYYHLQQTHLGNRDH